jgi:hypothetical protein
MVKAAYQMLSGGFPGMKLVNQARVSVKRIYRPVVRSDQEMS